MVRWKNGENQKVLAEPRLFFTPQRIVFIFYVFTILFSGVKNKVGIIMIIINTKVYSLK